MENKPYEKEDLLNKYVVAFLRISFVALLFYLSYIILEPFLILVVWSIIIAVGIYPLFEKLSNKLGGREKLASVLLVLIALSLIIIPSVLLLDSTISNIKTLQANFQSGTIQIPPPDKSVAEWPLIGESVYDLWKSSAENLETTIVKYAPQIKDYVPKLLNSIAGIGGAIFLTIFSIIIAGALLLQAEAAQKTASRIFNLLIGKDGEEITELSKLTIRSVVQGILGIAIIQSVASGVILLIFGIPMPGLWALVVMFLAIIQLPPMLVLLPIAIYGFNVLGTTSAVILLILLIIISASDTFLKPLFLGRGVDVPMLVILLGAIGGMIAFGILGLFIGAVILAIAYKVFQALLDEHVWIR